MKKIVRLTEGQLRQVIENIILKEHYDIINENNTNNIKQKIFANADKIKSLLAKIGITKSHINKLKSMLNTEGIPIEDIVNEGIWDNSKSENIVLAGFGLGMLSIAIIMLSAVITVLFPSNIELLTQIGEIAAGGVISGMMLEVIALIIVIYEED